MTGPQAKEFITRFPNAKSFVKTSHLEELSPLFEVHVEALEVSKEEFHDLQGSFAPKKETIDKFGGAAGVSYNSLAETTRKEGEGCYVGRSQATVMGPDGKTIFGDVCEYEFDVDVRLEELKLKGKAEWNNGSKSTRDYNAKELAQERVSLQKVARQRANTGARSRATLSILGMQTGFKGLFQKNDPETKKVTFLFSRIIVNAKNEMVMNRMLDSIGGNVTALFGPSPMAQLSEHHGVPAAEAGFRNVSAEPAAPADDWEDEPAAPATDPRVAELQTALHEYIASGNLPQKGIDMCQGALDRGESDPIILEDLVRRAKAAHEKSRGAA